MSTTLVTSEALRAVVLEDSPYLMHEHHCGPPARLFALPLPLRAQIADSAVATAAATRYAVKRLHRTNSPDRIHNELVLLQCVLAPGGCTAFRSHSNSNALDPPGSGGRCLGSQLDSPIVRLVDAFRDEDAVMLVQVTARPKRWRVGSIRQRLHHLFGSERSDRRLVSRRQRDQRDGM